MNYEQFLLTLEIMAILAVVVFVSLYFVEASYGMLFNKKWGFPVSNKLAWVCMEAPVFVVMLLLWCLSPRRFETVTLLFFLLFELHYAQRSFVFPSLMKGHSVMSGWIMLMGIFFNLINGYLQGAWLFHLAPEGMYSVGWLKTPQFIIGILMFIVGMAINWNSDYIIRHLRKPGDTGHYLPKGGLYDYVTSANYFGEIVEWIGFAIMTWSLSGALFALWTFANLVPRSHAIYKRYLDMFGKESVGKRKRIIPFIY